MRQMAAVDPRFRIVYNFFLELLDIEKPRYVVVCRAKMPQVAQSLIESFPPLAESKTLLHMRNVHALNDEQVVKLSAMLLDTVVKAVAMSV